jgi:hypothetical protein
VVSIQRGPAVLPLMINAMASPAFERGLWLLMMRVSWSNALMVADLCALERVSRVAEKLRRETVSSHTKAADAFTSCNVPAAS